MRNYFFLFILLFAQIGFGQKFASPKQVPLLLKPQEMQTRIEPPQNFLKMRDAGLEFKMTNASFQVNFVGFTQPGKDAFNYAMQILSQEVASTVPIVINASFEAMPDGVLGSCGPYSIVYDFSGAPKKSTIYPIALANKLTGTDLDPANPDITVRIASGAAWYFGTDGNTPMGSIDFVSVILHEIVHGLGFYSSAYAASGTGQLGYTGSLLPAVYDPFMVTGSGNTVISYSNPSAALGMVLTGDDLFFDGPKTKAKNGGVAPKLFAPSGFAPGSSISHWDENSYPAGNANSLMTPYIGYSESNHNIGDCTRGLLLDIGWNLSNTAPVLASIPSQLIYNGAQFSPVQLANYVNDDSDLPAQITWSVSGGAKLQASITGGNLVVQITDTQWAGTEVFTLTATDSDGASSNVAVPFTVKNASSAGNNCVNRSFDLFNFDYWETLHGNRFTTPILGFDPNRITLITDPNAFDPYSNYTVPMVSPNNKKGVSVRLGNSNNGAEVDVLRRTIIVTKATALLVYEYAVFLEDVGHPAEEQPYFSLKVVDAQGNIIDPQCGYYKVVAAGTMEGFINNGPIRYKPWTTVGLDLSPYIGQSITLEFEVGDCSQQGHFGYAYLNVWECLPMEIDVTFCPGAPNVTLSAPVGFAAYKWNSGQTTREITIPVSAINNTYSCELISVTGCSVTVTAIIIMDKITAKFTTKNNDCPLANAGEIAISNITGGKATITFSNDGGKNYQSAPVFTGLSAGVYPVYVTDGVCPQSLGFANITEPANFMVATQLDSIKCNGDNNGKILTTVSGGTAPYTYSFNGKPSSSSNIISGLGPGLVNVTITDAKGCVKPVSVNVVEPPKLAQTTTSTNIACYGSDNGAISVQSVGGTAPITWTITGKSPFLNTSAFTNLGPGVYLVISSDSKGCTTKADTVKLVSPAQLVISNITKTDIQCFGGKGSITIVASGEGLLQYSIDNGVTYKANNGVFTNLVSGTYDIMVKDANGCTLYGGKVTINEPQALAFESVTFPSAIPCFGDSVYVIAKIKGGTAPYLFSLDGITYSANNGVFILNKQGMYNIYVKDANGCTLISQSYFLKAPLPLKHLYTNKTDNPCFGDVKASLAISVTGGTGSLEYSSNNGNTWQKGSGNFPNLASGTFYPMVKDSVGCLLTLPAVQISEPAPLTVDNAILTDVSCYGQKNGIAEIIVSGGTLPYLINNGVNSTWIASNKISGLGAGNYKFTIQDKNKCNISISGTISQPEVLAVDTFISHSICPGDLLGSITGLASGGNGGYIYSLTNASTGIILTNTLGIYTQVLPASYVFTVLDKKGCNTMPVSVQVNGPKPWSVSLTTADPICFGESNGFVKTQVTGANAGYNFLLNNNLNSNNGDFLNLLSGKYSVRITDFKNCIFDTLFTLNDPEKVVISKILVTNDTCALGTGIAQITAAGSNTLYTGFDTTNYSLNKFVYNKLVGGTYTVYVKNQVGCRTSAKIQVLAPATALGLNNLNYRQRFACNNDNNAYLNVAAIGGTEPYLFKVYLSDTTVNNTGKFLRLGSGKGKVLIIDKMGCSISQNIEIVNPPALAISAKADSVKCYGGSDATMKLTGSGGTGKYLYSLDKLNWGVSPVITGLKSGSYTAYVKDDSLCITQTPAVFIPMPDSIYFTKTDFTDATCKNNGTIIAEAKGGWNQTYTYTLRKGNTILTNSTGKFLNLSPGAWTLSVNHTGNRYIPCFPTKNITLENFSPKLNIDFGSIKGCSPLKIKITNNSMYVDTFEFKLSNGMGANIANPAFEIANTSNKIANYTLSVFGIRNLGNETCVDTLIQPITVYPKPIVDFAVGNDTIFYPELLPNLNNTSDVVYKLGEMNWSINKNTSIYYGFDPPSEIDFKESGMQTVTLTGKTQTTLGGCTLSETKNVFIKLVGQPQISNSEICSGKTISYSNLAPFVERIEWRIQKQNDPNFKIEKFSNSDEFTPESGGKYIFELKVFAKGEFHTSYDTILVFNQPKANFEIDPPIARNLQRINFKNLSFPADVSCKWDFGDGEFSDVENPTYFYETDLKETTFNIKLTVNNSNCVDEITKTVLVRNEKIVLPNAFTPNQVGAGYTTLDNNNNAYGPKVWNFNVWNFEMRIFNLNGEQLFKTADFNVGWDGYFNSILCPQGVYNCKVTGKYEDGEKFELFQSFLLIHR